MGERHRAHAGRISAATRSARASGANCEGRRPCTAHGRPAESHELPRSDPQDAFLGKADPLASLPEVFAPGSTKIGSARASRLGGAWPQPRYAGLRTQVTRAPLGPRHCSRVVNSHESEPSPNCLHYFSLFGACALAGAARAASIIVPSTAPAIAMTRIETSQLVRRTVTTAPVVRESLFNCRSGATATSACRADASHGPRRVQALLQERRPALSRQPHKRASAPMVPS